MPSIIPSSAIACGGALAALSLVGGCHANRSHPAGGWPGGVVPHQPAAVAPTSPAATNPYAGTNAGGAYPPQAAPGGVPGQSPPPGGAIGGAPGGGAMPSSPPPATSPPQGSSPPPAGNGAMSSPGAIPQGSGGMP